MAKIAVIVLAAGKSRRFGPADKLLSLYKGKPLAAHLALTLRSLPFNCGAVVVRNPVVASLFHHTHLKPLFPSNTSAQSHTLRAGLAYAERKGASHALLLLADMPNVTPLYIKKMMANAGQHPIISHNGRHITPPALIPRHLFAKFRLLRGDQGAGQLLRNYPSVRHMPICLEQSFDIDERSDLLGKANLTEK